MRRKLIEKYILELSDKRTIEEIGKEGFERVKIHKVGFKSPRMFFLLDSAFRDFISYISFNKQIKSGLSFDEIEDLKFKILKSKSLPDNLYNELENEYKTWRMKEKHLVIETRLSNVDNNPSYIESVNPIVVGSFEDLIKSIKEAWVSALSKISGNIVVQITEIPSYDFSGFVYINDKTEKIEVNTVYGLWVNNEKVEHYDLCIANLNSLDVENYVIGDQSSMKTKSGNHLLDIPVSDEWRKNYKLSQTQLKNILTKSRDLAKILKKPLEFSFGIYKNDLYIHDLRDFKSDFFNEEYVFSEDFFGSTNININNFKNDLDAISNIELPFFLREEISTIEENIDKSSNKNLFVNRLKGGISLNKRDSSNDYRRVRSVNEILKKEKDYSGFLVDFEILLSTVNNLEKSSPEKIYNILKQNVNSIQNHFKGLSSIEKEIILKLTKLTNKNESANTKFFTKTLDLVPLRSIGLEILIFKNLIENEFLKNLSLSLPALRSFEEMEFVLSILNLSEFNAVKNNTAKIYADLSIPSMLFEYSKEDLPKKYLMDGILIDLQEFMKSFLNKKVFTERDYDLANQYLLQNIHSVRNKSDKLILITKNVSENKKILSTLSPDLVVQG